MKPYRVTFNGNVSFDFFHKDSLKDLSLACSDNPYIIVQRSKFINRPVSINTSNILFISEVTE